MKFHSIRERLLATTIVGGAALGAVAATPTMAQQAPAPAAGTVSEVVITGSRIPRPNLTSSSPITTVNSQDIKLSGHTEIVDILASLPQSGATIGNTQNVLGSTTYTAANLRDLGANRTLVLIDGHRLAPADPTSSGAANLNQIPTQLVDRVEVLTGGASAVYGSDAIAGVVNFIMKKNFEGVQIDVNWGGDQHDNTNTAVQQAVFNEFGTHAPSGSVFDGRSENVTITVGTNTADGKGNVTGYMTYTNTTPVTQGQRDYSYCLLSATHTCSGSSNSNRIIDFNGNTSYQVVGSGAASHFVPWGSAGETTTPPAIFNSAPYEYLSRADTRYQGGFMAHYDVNSHIQAYADFSYTSDNSSLYFAPGGSFLAGADIVNVNCDNPLLTAAEQTTLATNHSCAPSTISAAGVATFEVGRRDIEGGPRENFASHEAFRVVSGIKGDIDDVWSYDFSGAYGQSNYQSTSLGYFDEVNFQNSLLVTGTAANPVCISGGTCVPYNLFVGGGSIAATAAQGVTAAALKYVEAPSVITGETTEQVVNLNFVGKLGRYGITSPFAKDGVGVSLGAEYRREYLQQSPDEINETNALEGGGGVVNPISGAFDVKEAFGEIRIPVIQAMPFVRDLEVEAGYRRADYSSAGTVGAYKFALDWSIDRNVRLRGSFERAVRAPNVTELYAPDAVTNVSPPGHDPCSGSSNPASPKFNPTLASLQACERTGVTAAQYGTGSILDCVAGQCSVETGGNQALKPETSDTTSMGVVFTPTFLKNFSFTADYYNINIMGEIGGVPASLALANCIAGLPGPWCGAIHRSAQGYIWGGSDPASGGFIASTNQNIGYTDRRGIDFELNYRLNLSDVGLPNIGSLAFNFVGTWTDKFITKSSPIASPYDCAGYFGETCGSPTPAWKHRLYVTWATPWKVDARVTWRYIGGTQQDYANTQLYPAPTNVCASTNDCTDLNIPDYSYIDLAFTWHIRDHLVGRAGVNNIFDKDPPIISQAAITGTGTPNTFSNNYDTLGRQIFVGLTANF